MRSKKGGLIGKKHQLRICMVMKELNYVYALNGRLTSSNLVFLTIDCLQYIICMVCFNKSNTAGSFPPTWCICCQIMLISLYSSTYARVWGRQHGVSRLQRRCAKMFTKACYTWAMETLVMLCINEDALLRFEVIQPFRDLR